MEQNIEACYEIINYFDSIDSFYWPQPPVAQILIDYVTKANKAVNYFIGRPGELKSYQQNSKDFAAFLAKVNLYYADKQSWSSDTWFNGNP